MKKEKSTIIKKCPVCHRTFGCYAKNRRNHSHTLSGKYKRPFNAKTCSSRCSKIYARNWDYYSKLKIK